MGEQQTSPQTPEIKLKSHAPQELSMPVLDTIAGGRTDAEELYRNEHPDDADLAGFDGYYAQFIDAKLAEHGVTDDPDDADAHDAYQYTRDMYRRVADISSLDWITPDKSDGHDKPAREAYYFEIKERYANADPVAPDTKKYPYEALSAEERQEFIEKMKPISGKYAELLANHSRKMGFLDPNRETKRTQDELSYMISGIATDMMYELEVAGYDTDDITQVLDKFIAEQTEALIANIEEQKLAKTRNRNGFQKWALERWAAWAPEEGASFRKRVFSSGNAKKAALFAVPGAAIGAALAVPLGVVGAGAVAAGASIAVSRSIARNLIGQKLDAASSAETVAGAQTLESRVLMSEYSTATHEDGKGLVHTELLDLLQDQTDRYRKRNRNRLLGGMAISATAAVGVSGIVHAIAPEMVGLFGKAGDRVKDLFGHDNNPASTAPQGGGGTVPEAGPTPEKPDTAPHHNPRFKIVGSDERAISNGEGWYQTFREMGVSSKNYSELLKDVGPHLQDKGMAYWDGHANEWRMNMTENGEMPKYAIRYIAQTAHENGIHSDYDKFFDVANTNPQSAVENSAPAQDVTTQTDEVAGTPDAVGTGGVSEQAVAQSNVAGVTQSQGQSSTYAYGATNIVSDQVPSGSSYQSLNTTPETVSANQGAQSFVINELGSHATPETKAYYDALQGLSPEHKTELLNSAADRLKTFNTPDGEPLTYRSGGEWHFREVTRLSPEAKAVLAEVAAQNNWTLAS